MKRLFSVDESFHGPGDVLFAWRPDGNLLATAGANGAAPRCLRLASPRDGPPCGPRAQGLSISWIETALSSRKLPWAPAARALDSTGTGRERCVAF